MNRTLRKLMPPRCMQTAVATSAQVNLFWRKMIAEILSKQSKGKLIWPPRQTHKMTIGTLKMNHSKLMTQARLKTTLIGSL